MRTPDDVYEELLDCARRRTPFVRIRQFLVKYAQSTFCEDLKIKAKTISLLLMWFTENKQVKEGQGQA